MALRIVNNLSPKEDTVLQNAEGFWLVLSIQGDHHGCPYKTLDRDSLRAALQRLRIAPSAVEEAVTKAKVRKNIQLISCMFKRRRKLPKFLYDENSEPT